MNRWQQGKGSAHKQLQPVVFWLRVTVVLRRTLRLLEGIASINSQIRNRMKIMMNNITQNSCRIDCHADKQESRPVVPGMATDKKFANTKQKSPMLKSKRAICISTFNVQTLNRTAKLNEVVYNAQKFNISIIAIQEHRLIHEEPLKHHSLGDN